MRKILDITRTQVIYTESSEVRGIDLKSCNENYIQYRIKVGDKIGLTDKNIIGQRKADNKEIVIEFFTSPFTRFEFKSIEAYNAEVKKITKFGWALLDWS